MFPYDDQYDNQSGCIFNELLKNCSKEANPKESQDMIKNFMMDVGQDLDYTPNHKSSGEWVWADDQFKEENEEEGLDESKQEATTEDNFELKRIQSLRMEQQDKITMFLRKDSVGDV